MWSVSSSALHQPTKRWLQYEEAPKVVASGCTSIKLATLTRTGSRFKGMQLMQASQVLAKKDKALGQLALEKGLHDSPEDTEVPWLLD